MHRTATDHNRYIAQDMATAYMGERVEVTTRDQDYVTTLATSELRQLDYAAAALAGFLRLAARGADCADYQERAEELCRMVREGALTLPPDIAREVTDPDLTTT